MKEKDWDYIVKLERAIKQKYGELAIQNPASFWDEEKEKKYIEQLKTLYKKENAHERQSEKVEINGILISKKLLNRETNRKCPECEKYSFKSKDDVYMTKFNCCYECYLKYVEVSKYYERADLKPRLGENKCQK
tara:strand:+ start:1582 stop:1983 length:402 start_codon:yes stop_codon:yes gene_type:complete